MGQANYRNGFRLTLHEDSLSKPLNWKKPRRVFVNSMSDLFHKDVPIAFVKKVFRIMNEASWHVFQVLTKRSKRLLEISASLEWADNIWMGVSVENRDYSYRIEHLAECNATVKFLSLEPLLGPLPNLNLSHIDWVIVGGESGPQARPLQEKWIVEIRNACLDAGVPFFFKQWGGSNKKKTGRTLEGRTWDQMPKITQVRTLV